MVTLDRRRARAGADLAFADSGGEGRAVLFTHGAGLDHTMFDAQTSALAAAGYRVLVWDMRGHGQSTLSPERRFTAADALDDLAALCEECGIERVVLVGHSLGGNLSQAFARTDPGRVSGLIVLDSSGNSGPLTAFERLGLRLAAPLLAMVPARRLPALMARASAVDPLTVEWASAVFARMPKAVFLDVWRAAVSLIVPDPHDRSPVPLALIRGAEDRTGNIATAMPRWARAEGIDEIVIPGAGHIVTRDAPEETTAVLRGILDAWESPRA